jgi:hypothetical protein
LHDIFWAQEVHTTIHILNRGIFRSNNDKTPYELWKGRKTNVNHFRVFGRKCYIEEKMGGLESLTPELTKSYFLATQEKSRDTTISI